MFRLAYMADCNQTHSPILIRLCGGLNPDSLKPISYCGTSTLNTNTLSALGMFIIYQFFYRNSAGTQILWIRNIIL